MPAGSCRQTAQWMEVVDTPPTAWSHDVTKRGRDRELGQGQSWKADRQQVSPFSQTPNQRERNLLAQAMMHCIKTDSDPFGSCPRLTS